MNTVYQPESDGFFSLLPLPYAPDALAPAISAATLAVHHGKHLAAYVANLNALLPGSGLQGLPLADVVAQASAGAIANNAGQLLNHNLYFAQFAPPKADNRPISTLADAITRDFGSFEAFQAAFAKACAGLFGSGWVWLAADAEGHLSVTMEPNAGNPVQRGLTPLLTFDVWEHAYYLDYQNRRADHVAALWAIVDWAEVARRYAAAL